jgi:hypothetical protein
MAQPGYADAVADFEAFDRSAERADAADDFMAGNYRQFGLGQVAVDDVQVGAANAAGGNTDLDLLRTGFRIGQFHRFQGTAGLFENHRLHSFSTLGMSLPLPVMPAVSAKRIASSMPILQGLMSLRGTSNV